MNVNSNTYIFGFSILMVIIVAATLSFAATLLKPYQSKNVEHEKMQNILGSIGLNVERHEVEELYPKYIKQELVISNNKIVDGVNAFTIDMVKEVRRPAEERLAPLYIAEKDGETFYIIPLHGAGLWGPIWGYIALEKDISTIYGAVFDHKSETPGLGAEITKPIFTSQFKGKNILDESGNFMGIDIRKGDASTQYQVDGISGGTITSEGVELMIADCLKSYLTFLSQYSGDIASL